MTIAMGVRTWLGDVIHGEGGREQLRAVNIIVYIEWSELAYV